MHTLESIMPDSLPARESSLQSWIVCFSAALFFFFEFIQMNMFNAVSADLMQDFGINATQLGNLSAVYFYANLLFLPFAGMLLDRFSTRLLILITLLLCVIGIGSFALTHSLGWASVFRFMSGIGSAFCFLSSIRLASRWFSPQRMALVSGLIVTMAMTGGMVAQTPLTLVIEWVGWRNALLLDAALGMVIAGIIFAVVKDYPRHISNIEVEKDKAKLQALGVLESWRLSYTRLQNWLAGIFTSMLNLPVALLGAIWGNLYLVEVEHLSRIQASYVTTALFIGTLIGGPIAGWISDHLQRRCLPMRWGVFFSLMLILIVIYIPALPLGAYIALFFLLGCITSIQVISYPLVAESNSRMLTATSVSVISFCAIGGYAVFQPLFGWIMDFYWQGVMQNNMRIYSPQAFHHALLIIPLGFILAIIASFFLKESYCHQKD